MRCFFLVHMALRVSELSLRTGWLISQGSLKLFVPLFENAVAFGNLLRLDQCFKKVFSSCSAWIFVLLTHLPFHFSNSSSNFRVVSLFVFSDFPTTTFLISSFISYTLSISSVRCPWHTCISNHILSLGNH